MSETVTPQDPDEERPSSQETAVPHKSQRKTPARPKRDGGSPLPLRWAVILSIGTAVGVTVGLFGGPALGIPAGIAAVAALHKFVS